MQKIIAVLLFSAGILFVQNCSTKTLVSGEINRQWMLIEFQDFPRDLMVKNRANMDTVSYTHLDVYKRQDL